MHDNELIEVIFNDRRCISSVYGVFFLLCPIENVFSSGLSVDLAVIKQGGGFTMSFDLVCCRLRRIYFLPSESHCRSPHMLDWS